jgi:hypothetical protein
MAKGAWWDDQFRFEELDTAPGPWAPAVPVSRESQSGPASVVLETPLNSSCESIAARASASLRLAREVLESCGPAGLLRASQSITEAAELLPDLVESMRRFPPSNGAEMVKALMGIRSELQFCEALLKAGAGVCEDLLQCRGLLPSYGPGGSQPGVGSGGSIRFEA